jgi:metal-sulfur cluster biosynthetic enzyme
MADRLKLELDPNHDDEIDALEVFDMIRHIDDPEHPNTLEELNVLYPHGVTVTNKTVNVQFTPTIPNCGMATLIGLMIRVKLHRSLPPAYKVDILIEEGKHQ